MLQVMTPAPAPRTAFPGPVPTPVDRRAARAGTVSVAVGALLWACAAGVGAAALLGTPVGIGPLRVAGHVVTGWRGDRLAGLLGLLVTTVGLVVTSFATRYLHGDRRSRRFFVLVPATVVAVLLMVGATTLVGFAAGWTLSELGVLGLVGLHRPAPGAVAAHRSTARAFALGDAALWASVVVVVVTWGNLDLGLAVHRLPVAAGHGGAVAALAVLVPVAVAARCALAPLSRWLPATLAAPTPVSAFLHAGLVNAGGILLVRLAPVTGGSGIVLWPVFLLGACTVLAAGAAALVEPSVKGTLVRSTSAQMGFMVACCGMGWYVAAVLHLVAHGLYKSTLFLGSGAAVAARSDGRLAPPRATGRPWVRAAAALLGPALAVGWAWTHAGPVPADHQLAGVAVLGWMTAAWLTWGWLGRLTSPGGSVAVVVAMSVVAGTYVLAARAVGALLAPSVAAVPAGAVPAWVALAAVAVLAALAVAVRLPGPRRSALGRRAWVLASGVSRPRPAPVTLRRAPTARGVPVPAAAPAPCEVAA